MSTLYLHVGIMKTGTTFLQYSMFPYFKDTLSIGKPDYMTPEYREFQNAVRLSDRHIADTQAQPWLQQIKTYQAKNLVMSDETLCKGIPSLVADRLYRFCPEAHVILTLRSQYTAIVSHYINHGFNSTKFSPLGHRQLHTDFDEYFDFYARYPDYEYFRVLKYYDLIRSFTDLFGQERVHVFLYEDMRDDIQAFKGKFETLFNAPFLGADQSLDRKINQSRSRRMDRYQRMRKKLPITSLSHMIPACLRTRIKSYLSKGARSKVELSAAQREKIVELFGQQNAMASEYFGLNLSAKGYPVAAERPIPG